MSETDFVLCISSLRFVASLKVVQSSRPHVVACCGRRLSVPVSTAVAVILFFFFCRDVMFIGEQGRFEEGGGGRRFCSLLIFVLFVLLLSIPLEVAFLDGYLSKIARISGNIDTLLFFLGVKFVSLYIH